MWLHLDEQRIDLKKHDLVNSDHFGYQVLLVAKNVIFFDATNEINMFTELCVEL